MLVGRVFIPARLDVLMSTPGTLQLTSVTYAKVVASM